MNATNKTLHRHVRDDISKTVDIVLTLLAVMNRWKIVQKIGSGSFGRVFKAKVWFVNIVSFEFDGGMTGHGYK